MDYGDILSRGWQIIWNNKYLWILGFLATLGSANSIDFNNSFSQDQGQFSTEQLAAYEGFLIGFTCVVIVIGLVVWIASLVARGGLVGAVDRIEQGEDVTLGQAFGLGAAKVWRLVGLSLVLFGPFFLLMLASGVAAFAFIDIGAINRLVTDGPPNPEAVISLIGPVIAIWLLFLCLLVPFLVLVSFIQPFAFRGIMLLDLSIGAAIRHGWQVLRQNVVEIILLALLFAGIGIGYGLMVGFIMLPIGLVAFIPLAAITSFGTSEVGIVSIVLFAGLGLCLTLFGAALNSFLTTWRSASFTLAYRQFLEKTAPKKSELHYDRL